MWTCKAVRSFSEALVPAKGLKYQILGSETHVLQLDLRQGQGVAADPGALVMMEKDIEMATGTRGGLKESLSRLFSGAGLMLSSFKNKGEESARILLGPGFYSKVIPYELAAGKQLLCQRHTYLCGEEVTRRQDIKVESQGIGLLSGLFGGGGIVHQRLSGPGTVFLQGSGPIVAQDLKDGESISLHPENWVAYEPSVTFTLQNISGVKNMLWGEGLFLVTMKGPGKVLLQMMPTKKFVSAFSKRANITSTTRKGSVSKGEQDADIAVGAAAGILGSKSSPQASNVGQSIHPSTGMAGALGMSMALGRDRESKQATHHEEGKETDAGMAGALHEQKAPQSVADQEVEQEENDPNNDDDFMGGDDGPGVDDSKN